MTVTLRPLLDSDLPIFFEQQNDPVANQMAAFPAREREAFFAHWDKVRANSSNRYMTVVYDGQVAGNMLSFNMEGHREVGYWIGRAFWGKGIASEALAQFLKHEQTRPLYGVTVKHNHGSRRVLEKCGFVFVKEEGDEVFLILEQNSEFRRGDPMLKVQGIDHIGLAVKDVRASVEWYRDMFGLERLFEDVWGDFPGVVGIGDTSVAFFPTDHPRIPLPAGLPIHHIAFRVDRANFNAAQDRLRERNIQFEIQDHTIVHSLYFYDPDGHLIEVMTYELKD